MKRLFLLSILLLTSCTQLSNIVQKVEGVKITQSTIDTAMSGYVAAFQGPALTYRTLYDTNPCPAGVSPSLNNVCAKRSIVVKLQQVDAAVQAGLKRAQSQLDECVATGQSSCQGLTSAYTALTNAISTAEQALGAIK